MWVEATLQHTLHKASVLCTGSDLFQCVYGGVGHSIFLCRVISRWSRMCWLCGSNPHKNIPLNILSSWHRRKSQIRTVPSSEHDANFASVGQKLCRKTETTDSVVCCLFSIQSTRLRTSCHQWLTKWQEVLALLHN